MRISLKPLILYPVLLLVALSARGAQAQLTAEQFEAQQEEALNAWIGKPFPSFAFPGSRGKLYTNRDFKDRITLVDIWALGCSPCMFSIKYFNAIHDSLERRGFQLFSMVKNNWDDCSEAIRRDAKRRDYSLPLYEVISMESSHLTSQNLLAIKQLNSIGWPLFMVVDGKGIIREVTSGFDVGNDVHAERPAREPYANSSVQWMMAALECVQRRQGQ